MDWTPLAEKDAFLELYPSDFGDQASTCTRPICRKSHRRGMARDANAHTEAEAEAVIRIDFKPIVENLREAVHLAIAHENTQPVFRKRLEPGKRQARTSSKPKPNSKIRIKASTNMNIVA
ncbi:hypothetical protein CDEST_15276 [Colletotrichum destructivum]|uniref:Uncharacterized protein n=1 Tax=Colletotrichum destructivum TaxID=34406 RepID=A0AAX4J3Y2_9PEZI|nr:hypothetical protein CDEST_15276 [Colletotrichum destructivum]